MPEKFSSPSYSKGIKFIYHHHSEFPSPVVLDFKNKVSKYLPVTLVYHRITENCFEKTFPNHLEVFSSCANQWVGTYLHFEPEHHAEPIFERNFTNLITKLRLPRQNFATDNLPVLTDLESDTE